MLQPRRIAARRRAPAGAPAGCESGNRSATACGSSRASAPARGIEVVTEGILTRMLQDDPALEGVGW